MATYSLKKLRVDHTKTVPYTFPIALGADQKKRLVFHCVPAGTTNKPLVAAALERQARRGGGKQRVTADSLEDGLLEACEIYPHHVIRGWENVFDGDTGAPVPFSPEECEKLMKGILEEAQDKLQEFTTWASELDNFRNAAANLSGN